VFSRVLFRSRGDASPLAVLCAAPPSVPPAARKEFAALARAVADCRAGDLGPAAQVERVRKFYEPIFSRIYDNPTVRLRDLDQLELIASGCKSRSQFITDLTLDPPSSTQDLAGPPLLDEDYLILSTIHSAKGCEWDIVHIIHAADGMIPSDMATGSPEEIDEERRLLYVAMTRPRNSLFIYFPLRYYHSGKRLGDAHSYAQVSRFLATIDKKLLERKAPETAGDEEAPAAPAATDGKSQSVQDMLKDLWSE
jgi:DNA helicase II / ATP-dependent DNA helicase PcrA